MYRVALEDLVGATRVRTRWPVYVADRNGDGLAIRQLAVGDLYGDIGVDACVIEAREYAERAGAENVEVLKGLIEALPVESDSVDWVISNCVLNLSPEKSRVFGEIVRVLRPGGQFSISDIVVEDLPEWIRKHGAGYGACGHLCAGV